MSTDPRDLEAEERALKAVTLRRAGATYDAIARAVGYAGPSSAHYAVSRYLKAVREEAQENAAELFQINLDRAEFIYQKAVPGISEGDPAAMAVGLRALERIAKMHGLDDYERRMAEVAERNATVTEAQAIMAADVMATAIATTPGMTPELRVALVQNVRKAIEATPRGDAQ